MDKLWPQMGRWAVKICMICHWEQLNTWIINVIYTLLLHHKHMDYNIIHIYSGTCSKETHLESEWMNEWEQEQCGFWFNDKNEIKMVIFIFPRWIPSRWSLRSLVFGAYLHAKYHSPFFYRFEHIRTQAHACNWQVKWYISRAVHFNL